MTNLMNLNEVLSAFGDDDEIKNLVSDHPMYAKLTHAQALMGEARMKVAKAALDIYNSDAGKVLFDHLIGAYMRRDDGVTRQMLPMDQAIQLHAARDGRREVINELLRLVREGQQSV
jgi:hypothetical protein